jgi:hypothetical protein
MNCARNVAKAKADFDVKMEDVRMKFKYFRPCPLNTKYEDQRPTNCVHTPLLLNLRKNLNAMKNLRRIRGE